MSSTALAVPKRPGMLRRMWHRVSRRSTYPIVLQIGGDGFISKLQFLTSSSGFEQLLAASSWAYACITMNAEAVATLPPIVQRRGKAGDEDEWVRADPGHPLEELLLNPFGPTPGVRPWPWSQVVETIGLQYLIAGNAHWRISRIGGRPRALLPFPDAGGVRPIANKRTGWASHYESQSQKYPTSDILHVMNASPGSILSGQSPLAVAMDAVNIDKQAVERQRYNLSNRIAPGLIVQMAAPIGKGEQDKVIAKMKADFGATSQDGKPIVISQDVKLTPMPDLSYQLNFFEARKFAREEIGAVFHTPPPLVGDYSNATLQNFDKAIDIWWSQALFPMAGTIYDTLNRQVVWPSYNTDVRLWYDVTGSPIGLQNLSRKIDVAQKLVNLGYAVNVAARRVSLGMASFPEGDVPNMQLALAGRADPPELPVP